MQRTSHAETINPPPPSPPSPPAGTLIKPKSSSILEIIINRRALVLRHALLLLIHLHHHPAPRRLLGPLILPFLDEAREPEADALAAGVAEGVAPGLVAGAEGQVGRLDLPDEAGLEPDVRLVLGDGGVGVERFGPVDDAGREAGVQALEHGLGEAGADVAHRFVDLLGAVVACEQEGAVHGGALPPAEIGPQHDEVERVADAGQVVFFHFEPVPAAFARLVAALVRVEHLDHQPFA